MSTLLASGGDDIKIWDTSEGFSLVKEYNPHVGNISSLAWSHDNSCLASTSSIGDKIAITYQNVNAASHSFDIGHEEQRSCLAYNSMSRYIMGGGPDGLVHIWDLKTRKLKKTYKGHKSAVTSLQFNWNDTVISSASEAGQIIIFSVVTGIGFSPLVLPKEQAVRQIQYSHFKKSMLASASDDGSVNLWDTSGKRLVHSYDRSHKAPAMGLAFSPLNEMLMMSVGLDKKIVCYDVVGRTAVKTMTAESPLTSIDLMSDGATLAVGSTRGKIYIYDLRQGATPINTISAHKSSVQSLKFQSSSQSKGNVGGKPKTPAPTAQTTKLQHSSSYHATDTNKINNNFISQQLAEVQKASSKTASAKSPSNFTNLMDKDEIFSPLGENTGVTSRRTHEIQGESCSPTLASRSAPLSTTDFTQEEQKLYGFQETNGAVSDSDGYSSRLPAYKRTEPMSTSVSTQGSSVDTREEKRLLPDVDLDVDILPSRHYSPPRPIPTSISQDTVSTTVTPSRDLLSNTGESHRAPVRSSPSPESDSAPSSAGGAAAAAVPALQPFHTQFISSIVEESLEDFREQIRQDVLNLHMEMLKQFLGQQAEIERIVKEHSINEELLAEVVRLKEENRRLKNKF